MISTAFRTASRFAVPRAASMMVPRAAVRATAPSVFARFNSNNALTIGSAVTKYAKVPPSVKYTEDHEWIAVHEDNVAFIGITKYAADALGDATFVELPTPGEEAEKGDSIGSVESVKSASDIYSPVSCEILEGNEALEENAARINDDPMGEAWIAKVKVTKPEELEELLSYEQYEDFLKSQ